MNKTEKYIRNLANNNTDRFNHHEGYLSVEKCIEKAIYDTKKACKNAILEEAISDEVFIVNVFEIIDETEVN